MPDMFGNGALKFGRNTQEFFAILIGLHEFFGEESNVIFHATMRRHQENTTGDSVNDDRENPVARKCRIGLLGDFERDRDITTVIRCRDRFLLRAALALRVWGEVSLQEILAADDATP